MIYLDTAALVKLVRREMASDALVDWIGDHPDELLVSSTLAEVELPRALRRTEPALLAAVPALLGRIAVYEIDDLVRATAAAYDDPLIGPGSVDGVTSFSGTASRRCPACSPPAPEIRSCSRPWTSRPPRRHTS
jgi:hypothetical protein